MNLCQFKGTVTNTQFKEARGEMKALLRVGIKVQMGEYFTFVDVNFWGEKAESYRNLEKDTDVIVYCKYQKRKIEKEDGNAIWTHNFNATHLYQVK